MLTMGSCDPLTAFLCPRFGKRPDSGLLEKERRGSDDIYVMENSSSIEPLPDDDDAASQDTMTAATSDYDPSIAASSFCSVSSSVNGHVWEYGRCVNNGYPTCPFKFQVLTPHCRRYQIYRYGRYPMPNDEEEFKRESLKHAMFKEVLQGKLYLAPIGPNVQKIMDLGTGFGDWAVESSSSYPASS